MMGLLIVSLILIVFSIILLILGYLIDLNKNLLKIKYKTFKRMYMIKPEAWEIHDSSLTYRSNDYRYIYFRMNNIFNYYRLLIFKHRKNKREKQIAEDEKMAEVLVSWQKDIEKYKEKIYGDLSENLKRGD